jgi:hypothetical protein
MAKTHSSTPSVPKQSQLDWNAPKTNQRTPRSEWRFMRKYELICGTQPHRGTGPLGGSGVIQ